MQTVFVRCYRSSKMEKMNENGPGSWLGLVGGKGECAAAAGIIMACEMNREEGEGMGWADEATTTRYDILE
ncbi:unnamed protein product [Onchocerca flexuosa]|uniref:Uncharacterized protein n=1 Tax=Onchocerca flexuosa TaxID=387005 RepID=A0A183H169_9BILA|nr:unnamed protein product [Onchocerca flexuosa]